MGKSEYVKVSKAALSRMIRKQVEMQKSIELLISRQKDIGIVLYHTSTQIQKLCEKDLKEVEGQKETKEGSLTKKATTRQEVA